MAKITGYKGFDKDFKCRGMQYEVGKTFTADKAVICEEGLHFCTEPIDVLKYYPIIESRYAVVSSDEELIVGSGDDSKKCTTKLTIERELTFKEFIEAITSSQAANSGDFSQAATFGYFSQAATFGYFSKVATSGDYSKAATSGCYSQAAASGNFSQVAASGNYSKVAASGNYSKVAASGCYSKVEVTGKNSVACAIGFDSMAKGVTGSWLVLADYKENDEGETVINGGKWLKVDGEKIKENTFYKLVDGEPVVVEE